MDKVIDSPSLVDCPYKDDCSSYPHRCDNCRNNRNKKKDYYQPDYYNPPYTIWWGPSHYSPFVLE